MKHRFVYIFVLVLVINSAIGRVYYVDNSNSISGNEPIYSVGENVEQSSRDLDLSFTAGELNDGFENSRPNVKKVCFLFKIKIHSRKFCVKFNINLHVSKSSLKFLW